MATNTTYFNLIKPAYEEDADVAVLNTDMDRIDSALYNIRLTNAENFAEIYDAAASYSAGDYCVYLQADGYHLYKANASTTGAFDNTKWDEVVVTDELGGGGGGGGHTYIGNDGSTPMTQRANAEFVGAYMQDASADDTTKVNIVRRMRKSEFDLLSAAEKKGFIDVYDITSGRDDRFMPIVYSTEEQEIGVWTDGKPLYQKTIDTGALPNASSTSTAHGISNLEEVVDIEGVCYQSTNKFWRSLPLITDNNTNYLCTVSVNATYVYLYGRNADLSNYTESYITLRYTKSTDTAGSGKWTPQGVPSIKYSTSEQIIGTWTDGKTLYQKTVDIELADSSNMQTFTASSLAIGVTQVIVDACFKNSGGQQLRQAAWFGNDYWSYIIGSSGDVLVKRQTTDANWASGVHLILTTQYTKASS